LAQCEVVFHPSYFNFILALTPARAIFDGFLDHAARRHARKARLRPSTSRCAITGMATTESVPA